MQMELTFDPKSSEKIEKQIVAVPVGEESVVDADLKAQLEVIPNRMAFKIGEVADMAEVKPYVIRYWESEFDVIKPKKSRHNQRVFERKDVEFVLIIKKLLYKDKYSIEGARAAIKRYKKSGKKAEAILASQSSFQDILSRTKSLIEKIETCLYSV